MIMGGNPEAARGSAGGGLGKTVPGRRTSEGCRASVLDHLRGIDLSGSQLLGGAGAGAGAGGKSS